MVAVIAAILAVASEATARDGRAIYEASCAACHGSDGRGEPGRDAAYPVPMPDFTDCSFATPEPNNDWLATIHDGGAARGFDRRMPAFREVLNDDEIRAVVDHLRTFCTASSWPRGELNLARAMFTEKAFPEDEAVVTTGASRSEITSTLVYEKRFGARWQLELTLPWQYLEQDSGGWAGGLGDIAIGMKRVLAASLGTGTILSALLEVSAPTGRQERGLGTGTSMIEASLLAAQRLTSTVFVQVHAGGAVAYDRSYPDEVFARLALGDQIVPVRFGRMFSPIVEVTATRELDSEAATDVDIVPQLQVTLSRRQHIRAAAGVQVPVTDRAGRDTTALVYVLWDFADGALTEGW